MHVSLGTNRIRPIVAVENSPGIDSHRLGGRAPKSITPKSPDSRYFFTIGLDEDNFISVFLMFPDDYYLMFDKDIQGEGESVEVFFHPRLPRREDDAFKSDLSAHELALEPEKSEGPKPDGVCKLGGEVANRHGHGTMSIVTELKEQGFEQYIQLDVPNLNSDVVLIDGDPGPGDGPFHLFLKPLPDGSYDWRCFWQI